MAPGISSRRVAELFWKFSARSTAGGFGRRLGLLLPEDGGAVEIGGLSPSTCSATVTVPGWLCDEGAGGGVTAAGLIALMDEVSSFTAAAVWDSRCRPGVSVQLSGLLTEHSADVGGGSRVEIVSRLQRQGRTLTFVEVRIFSARKLIMSGRHIKFMPGTGLRPEWLMAPTIRGVTFPVAEWVCARRPLVPFTEAYSFQEVFGPSADEARVNSDHANPLGMLHGGASAILSAQRAATVAGRRVRGLTANYLNGVRLDKSTHLCVTVQDVGTEGGVVAISHPDRESMGPARHGAGMSTPSAWGAMMSEAHVQTAARRAAAPGGPIVDCVVAFW